MEKELMEMLAGVIERNTSAMEKMAKVTEEAGKSSARMATEVCGLRRIIAGAQEKIGEETTVIATEQEPPASEDAEAEPGAEAEAEMPEARTESADE